MTIRIKRKLRGADGGKHPHVKDAQDFPFNPPPPRDELRTQARMALLLMQPHAEAAGVADATPYVTAVAALKNLMEWLK